MILRLNTKTSSVNVLDSSQVCQHSVLVNKVTVYFEPFEKLESEILVVTYGKYNAITKQFEPSTNNIPFTHKPRIDIDTGQEVEGKYQYEAGIPTTVLKQSGTHCLALAIKRCINPSLPFEQREYKVITYPLVSFSVDASAQIQDDGGIVHATTAEALIQSITDINEEQAQQNSRAYEIENDLGIIEQLPSKIPQASRSSVVGTINWIVENMGDTSGSISRKKAEFVASEFVNGNLTLSLVGQEIDFKMCSATVFRYKSTGDYEQVVDEVVLNNNNETLTVKAGRGFNGFVVIDSKQKGGSN